MCTEANRLRAAWYKVTPQINPTAPEEVRMMIFSQQANNPEYQNALAELRDHIAHCQECQASIRSTTI